MKKKTIIFIILFISWFLINSDDSRVEDFKNLQNVNGIVYIVNEDKPYTGTIINYYENGKVDEEVNYKNGKLNGEAIFYHENGKVHTKVNYKNGELSDFIKH